MAKTDVLRGRIEEGVRKELAKRFGRHFLSEKVPLRTKSNGTIATYEVDAVSEDNKIIAAIYAGSRSVKGTLLNKLWKDAYFLLQIQSVERGVLVERRLLVFADKNTADSFRNMADGKYDPRILEIVDVRLHPSLERERKRAL